MVKDEVRTQTLPSLRGNVAPVSRSHVLITRFNLRVPQWSGSDRNGVPVLTDEWMEHRFNLFDAYTVPSVVCQTVNDFLWMVLFDIETDTKWLNRIDTYGKIFLPVFLSPDWLYELQMVLQGLDSKWLVTTRVDNDDAIAPTFIEVVQKNVRNKKEFLNIPNGWVRRDGVDRPVSHQANPFMTYVELSKEARSIYFTPHGRGMQRYAPIRQITNERLWTQVIHERNYVNA